jgi:hypothetical protein
MKVSGILETHTKDKAIYRKRIPIKISKLGDSFTIKLSKEPTKFFLNRVDIRFGKPIYYEITKPTPLVWDIIPTDNKQEKQYLIVTFSE